MSRLQRLARHLLETHAGTRRRFHSEVLDAVEAAVRAAEARHHGELRFVVETDLHVGAILAGRTARERALEVFSALRVWDTAANNGILIYVLSADRAVEIVADRGFNDLVTAAEWAAVCRIMEGHFRDGHWREGALAGVAAAATLLARHFPGSARDGNELPDRPVLL